MMIGEADSRAFDVVVVGNGVLGLSLALTLTRRELRVAVVGEPSRPYAATTAAGAMLGCFGETTTGLLKSELGRHKLDLAVRARGLWPDWLAALKEDAGASDLVTADGTVVMLNTVGLAEVDDGNYEAIRQALTHYDEPHEEIDPAEIGWLDPDPLSRPLRALHIPDEHAVDSGKLLNALGHAVQRTGGTFVPENATSLVRSEGRIEGVELADGTRLSAPQVVLATGARTQDLLDTVPEVAARVPRVCGGVGVSAVLRHEGPTPRQVLRTPNRAFACGLHMVPRGAGEIYVGATNIVEPVAADTPVVRETLFLLTCATRQLRRDLWKSGLHRLQVGNRPVALDGFPLLGETELPGLWMMTGTYRDGLHLSPLLAAEFARRLAGEGPQADLAAFTPTRPPLQPMTREEIVDTAVTHMLATGFEYDWHIPVEWPHMIANHLRLAFTKFADELDPQYTPPAEILAKARVSPELVTSLKQYYAATREASPETA